MENRTTNKPKSFLGLMLVAFTVFLKSSKLLVVLKTLKFTKPLVTIVTMVISAFMYGLWLGPWFGIGLVAMLFIHEMGHIIALRMKGYETSGPVFIPFIGALIFSPKFEDRDTEAFVGYGGPLLGTIGALACLVAWAYTEDRKTAEILLLVSYLGIFLNLFNLIPISPLDGGRITQVVGNRFKYVGLLVLLAYTLAVGQPGLLLIWILVLDYFDRMTLWLRPMLSAVLGIAMVMLMLSGVGTPGPFYMVIIDSFFAALFTAIYYFRDQDRKKNGTVEVDVRPYPAVGVRAKWLVYYFGLAILTTVVLIWQAQHLPQAVKRHSEELSAPSHPNE